METTRLSPTDIPYFAWDRRWTVSDIQGRLATTSGMFWRRVAAWILREAAFEDVWQFLSPQDVAAHLVELEPFLGRKREFWTYIMDTWGGLGRL